MTKCRQKYWFSAESIYFITEGKTTKDILKYKDGVIELIENKSTSEKYIEVNIGNLSSSLMTYNQNIIKFINML